MECEASYVASTIEGIVKTTVGKLYEVVLNLRTLGKLSGIDEVSSTKLAGPRLLVRVGVDSDDTGSLNEVRGGDDSETDGTTSKHSDGRSL